VAFKDLFKDQFDMISLSVISFTGSLYLDVKEYVSRLPEGTPVMDVLNIAPRLDELNRVFMRRTKLQERPSLEELFGVHLVQFLEEKRIQLMSWAEKAVQTDDWEFGR
jgi:hypothetical protein